MTLILKVRTPIDALPVSDGGDDAGAVFPDERATASDCPCPVDETAERAARTIAVGGVRDASGPRLPLMTQSYSFSLTVCVREGACRTTSAADRRHNRRR